MNRLKILPIAFLLLLMLFISNGCVKRNMHIESRPMGASVYFNDDLVGTTPLDFDFIWYAVHKVTVKKEGYKTLTVLENIRPPLFCWPPLDFFFEIIPYKFWDRQELSYTLEPFKPDY